MVAPTSAFQKAQPEKVGNIEGRRAQSLPEWRFAVALYRARIPFQYQVSFFGGRRLKGGQVVDFIVLTRPIATAVFVDGDYWHGTAAQRERDRFKRALITTQMGKAPIVLTGSDLATQQLANSKVLELFGDRR